MSKDLQDPESESSSRALLIALLVLAAIIIILSSFSKNKSLSLEEFKRTLRASREDLENRHKYLLERLEKNLKKKAKLDRLVRNSYFVFRFLIIFIWGLFAVVLHQEGQLNNLSDFLNYTNALIIFILVINYLIFGSLKSLNDFNERVKLIISNWVYGDYAHLEKDIKSLTNESQLVEEQINTIGDIENSI